MLDSPFPQPLSTSSLVYLLVCNPLLHTPYISWPLTVSCSSIIQIGFTFLVLAHPGSPGQRAVKRVCVSLLLTKESEQVMSTIDKWRRPRRLVPKFVGYQLPAECLRDNVRLMTRRKTRRRHVLMMRGNHGELRQRSLGRRGPTGWRRYVGVDGSEERRWGVGASVVTHWQQQRRWLMVLSRATATTSRLQPPSLHVYHHYTVSGFNIPKITKIG